MNFAAFFSDKVNVGLSIIASILTILSLLIDEKKAKYVLRTVAVTLFIVMLVAINGETVKPETTTPTQISVESDNSFSGLGVGDTFYFGSFEQDLNYENGAEAIEWIVVDRDDRNGRILAMSVQGLDCVQYDNQDASIMTPYPVSWGNCSLCSWLNDYFYDEAFSQDEQGYICNVTIDGVSNNVFILSDKEYNKYSSKIEIRKCKPTQYAILNDAYVDVEGCTWWWLRSSITSSNAPSINSGSTQIDYFRVNGQRGTVRPVIWVDIE